VIKPETLRKIEIKTFQSYEEADQDYEDDLRSLTPEERVSIVEHLRRQYFLIKNLPLDLKVKRVVEKARLEE
jgi:hypothetical protein